MGSGKTAAGRLFARRIGWTFVDLDRAVERSEGKSVSRIFREGGEAAFRRLERRAFLAAAARNRVVVACGGGAVEDAATRRRLATEQTVWLSAPLAILARRLGRSARKRPLFGKRPPVSLYRRRARLYRACARVRISTGGRNTRTVAALLAARLG